MLLCDICSVCDYICIIVDFFKEGILFCDVIMFFVDVCGFCMVVDQLLMFYVGECISKVVGFEVWGFIFGGVVVYQFLVGFVLICKKGKLFGVVISEVYVLEYGEVVMELYDDVLQLGECVLIVDDFLVIGGMVVVVIKLCECLGVQIVGCVFVIDLFDLGGCILFEGLGYDVYVLIEFDGYQFCGSVGGMLGDGYGYEIVFYVLFGSVVWFLCWC